MPKTRITGRMNSSTAKTSRKGAEKSLMREEPLAGNVAQLGLSIPGSNSTMWLADSDAVTVAETLEYFARTLREQVATIRSTKSAPKKPEPKSVIAVAQWVLDVCRRTTCELDAISESIEYVKPKREGWRRKIERDLEG